MADMGHSRRIGTLTTLAACPLCLRKRPELVLRNEPSRSAMNGHRRFSHLVGNGEQPGRICGKIERLVLQVLFSGEKARTGGTEITFSRTAQSLRAFASFRRPAPRGCGLVPEMPRTARREFRRQAPDPPRTAASGHRACA